MPSTPEHGPEACAPQSPLDSGGVDSYALIDRMVGSYRVTARIGEGGMGTVYRAEHPVIGRKVAIKVLRSEYCSDPETIARFTREARAAATLRHPAIIDVFDYGVYADGRAYIVMDYLEGQSLDALIDRAGKLPPATAAEYVRQIAGGVAVAHRAGVVHRDLKPGNVFVTLDPALPSRALLKVLDFGIAKLSAGPSAMGTATRTNAVIGTPRYMAPEQCRGAGHVDHRADIYSLGCILYELLLGRPPFLYEGPGELIAAHLFEAPIAPCVIDPILAPQLEALVLKMLAKQPDARPQSMDVVVADLTSFLALEGGGETPQADCSTGEPTDSARLAGAAGSCRPQRQLTERVAASAVPAPAQSAAPPADQLGASATMSKGASLSTLGKGVALLPSDRTVPSSRRSRSVSATRALTVLAGIVIGSWLIVMYLPEVRSRRSAAASPYPAPSTYSTNDHDLPSATGQAAPSASVPALAPLLLPGRGEENGPGEEQVGASASASAPASTPASASLSSVAGTAASAPTNSVPRPRPGASASEPSKAPVTRRDPSLSRGSQNPSRSASPRESRKPAIDLGLPSEVR